jgi:hypothetical protein
MQLSDKFYKNDSCSIEVIRKIEAELGKSFPTSYIEFLCWSNGGEGKSENRERKYIYLWRCEDIPQYNKDYAIQKWLTESIVAFGMEGDYGYAFDYREIGVPHIIGFDFGNLDICDVRCEAETFDEFIKDWL